MALQTEDLGKICEMAICLLADCEYQGEFRYSMEKSQVLKTRFSPLLEECRGLKHTGKSDNLHDFRPLLEDISKDLSVKSNKRGWMVCPQGGQGTKKTFCQRFGLPLEAYSDGEAIKLFVVRETPQILDNFTKSTFHCKVIYYNEPANAVWLIKQKSPIIWTEQTLKFAHLKLGKVWNESTTLYVEKDGKDISIGEFQNHNNRNCFKFRWNFRNLLFQAFRNHFDIMEV